MMLYVCAEQQGLHLYACKQMMPYFFAAGHANCVHYVMCYIKAMEKLPVLHLFLCREHVTHHQEGIWNAIWINMLIVITFVRYGKGPTGFIDVTTKP